MNLGDATRHAFDLLFGGDATLWGIIYISLRVSFLALIVSAPFAIALGFTLATFNFPGRRVLVVLVQSLMAMPTVVTGLIVYLLLTRHGPFGQWQLLFTQEAMIIGQAVLAFPILAAMTLSAVQGADPRIRETALTLGAGALQTALTTMAEVRFAVMAAMLGGLGRIISEIGCAMMVGGNIAGVTRNITTAIALETSKGEFSQGIALGVVLMMLALVINALLHVLQGRGDMK